MKPTRAEYVKSLEDEQKSMQESLGSSQTEINEMQGLQDNIAEQQKTTEASLQRVQCELAELQRRHIKLESHSRRGNLKFYGIKEREHESNEDREDLLRKFLRTDLKIPKEDKESSIECTGYQLSSSSIVWHSEFQATTDYCQAFQIPRQRVY